MYSNYKINKSQSIEIKTFSSPLALKEIIEIIAIKINIPSNLAKEEIINQALKFHLKGNILKARLYYQYCLANGFDDHRVFSNYGTILKNLGNLKEAEIFQRKAISLNPNHARSHYNLANTLKDLGRLKEAQVSLSKSIEIDPFFSKAHNNLGLIKMELGNIVEAESYIRKSIKISPDYHDAYFNLSVLELLKGDYKSGLEKYEFRFLKEEPTLIHGNPKIERINDKKLNQEEKILIISEQALGDIIFHMRYVVLLIRQGFDISFCAPKKLHNLIKDSGVHSKPILPDESHLINEGKWIPLLSLPKYLGVNVENPIINTPYISSTETLKSKWSKILSNERKPIIGINWQGSKKLEQKSYPGRSIPLEKFSKLLEVNDISFLSLQKGYGSEQIEKCNFKDQFVRCQDEIDQIWDYSETAAIIENCDLIITIDCSIGPLAAGMGKPVWLMLRKIPFWTWGIEGKRTFWYPTMKLFRQKEFSNWDDVMEIISIELEEFINNINENP